MDTLLTDEIQAETEKAEPEQRGSSEKSARPQLSQAESVLRKLPALLRRLGIVVLLGAAATFMVLNRANIDSVHHYYYFLIFTLVLTGAGLFCGLKMKDTKGARTFLGLAAAFLPAHFLQLGALLYSLTHRAIPSTMPGAFIYTAVDSLPVYIATVVASVILIAVAYAGFSVLSREEAKRLTMYYVTANLFLLLPVRLPDAVTPIAAALFGMLAIETAFRAARHGTAKTVENFLCRAMLFLPLIVLVGRTALLWGTSHIFSSILLTMIGTTGFYFVPRQVKDRENKDLAQLLSTPVLASAWLMFAQGAFFERPWGIFFEYQQELLVPVGYLPIAGLFLVLSFSAVSHASVYRKIAALLATSLAVLELVTIGGIGSSLLLVAISLVTIIYAFSLEDRIIFYTGVAGFGLGLLYHVRYAVDLLGMSPWLSLAILGTAVVLIASHLEKNFHRIAERVTAFRQRVRAWE